MNEEEFNCWIDSQWKKIKQELPIGSRVHGRVFRIKPFGIFLNIGYEVIGGYQLSGLIDIITQVDEDSHGLPIDYSLWPSIGDIVHCKVVWYRDTQKEVSLSIVNDSSTVTLKGMTTLQQVIEAALSLPSEEQDALMAAIVDRKRSDLVAYARQAALDVKDGKLQTRSVAEIMSQLDDSECMTE